MNKYEDYSQKIENDDIICFSPQISGELANPLNLILRYLKALNFRNYRFSCVEDSPQMLPSLTLTEQLAIECLSFGPIAGAWISLTELVNETNNQPLKQLFQLLKHPDLPANQLTIREKKIACLVKSFLRKTDLTILIKPLEHLRSEEQQLLINAMKIAQGQQAFLIVTDKLSPWRDSITKHLVKGPHAIRLVPEKTPALPVERPNTLLQLNKKAS